MLRYMPALIASLFVLSPVVAAEEGAGGHAGTLQQQEACRADVLRYCADSRSKGDYAMADCLKANERKLKPSCRESLARGR